MVTCDGCGARINSQWYRSLEVDDNCDLCQTCFSGEMWLAILLSHLIGLFVTDGTGSRPDDHKPEHKFIRLGRFICDGCRMLIWSHRFHSNTKDDYDLCLGCYRANGGLGDQWTYFPMTLQPQNDKHNPYYSINPGVCIMCACMCVRYCMLLTMLQRSQKDCYWRTMQYSSRANWPILGHTIISMLFCCLVLCVLIYLVP